ncbi:hypothetical protein J4206_04865 [Candidatus Woesearchaeota archaeon]|nr:hypothetical protein [Candidatus Woesearchaeota archaeon]
MKSAINFFKRIIFTVKVYGESCWPELVPSKRYLATNLFKPKIGDYIVFKTRFDETFVKKVHDINKGKDESYFVTGTVSWGDSSREFGLVDKNSVIGKLLYY